MSQVVFLTKDNCSLCDAARPLVERACRRRGHALRIEDGSVDPWAAEYAVRLPVVLRDGTVVLEGRFDGREVRRALR